MNWNEDTREDGIKAAYAKEYGSWVVADRDGSVLYGACPCCQKQMFSREAARSVADGLVDDQRVTTSR